ncbi:MAG: 16S rRNA (cytosine(1402)-N(4))-methyltransferase RsmH [Desulfobacula sp.]|jgi:16S rRNA (cytosine1402-N4)-methyltransferase|uniref:16S rRNA (cytosine(1402)-N(4))-methyltransferase RsmH n=1 Tax=Desulfobacula sp. TaxID=2593537 RepID=UPI001D36DEDF|nr:16S rRNA (cytosine(1402)-N(4))-methyltransferase RsmH [Desulfobacula sp.]MBT3483823.1 16S rRNA (cytosine(1402)-N(4))-methyltransferase RsmH [Desulfobacula sp.]MBT3803011.1 16S rRNA (cytosine(1402)-N(4))-methyltransferase RsmH [Desulfobacula sp.]MBT4023476.1 16S rRNA (cytosine(1402)-N(4))-methyltransferase RsmH [Desulfobacula sp.]MBT4197059.1 16S rRNA (cytosine(1402)-N(4))-methyltransferase RsmH [Desulfobacula sp.]
MGFEHTSVMPQEVHEHQNLKPGYISVDCTLGGAGHALATIRSILPNGLLIGIDQDLDAISHAKKILHPFKDNLRLFHNNFSDLPKILKSNKIKGVNSILLDLGFSLNQLKNGNRGFSFNKNEPLDMRMDIRNDLTAFEIINSFQEDELVNIFFKFGEEKFSRRIARRIVEIRKDTPIHTSSKLAQIVTKAIPAKFVYGRRIHPATRIFQALRIAVNKELECLGTFMEIVPSLLLKGGRLCVISFHSLEDRIVKQALRKFEDGCNCPKDLPICLCGFVPQMKSVFRKPLIPTKEEIEFNPMARSSKLRVAQKI